MSNLSLSTSLPAAAAPAGAPNVLIVLLDDMGFGASSAFGGPCRMPTAEHLADEGLRFSRFHTTALCSPTRAALLSGRNHHSVGMGSVTNLATTEPGYNGQRPAEKGTLAQTLQANGYATGAFGKMHQTPGWHQTPVGPYTWWPTNEGFEEFYGFLTGDTNQFTPNLVHGTTFVDPPRTEAEGYHVSEDLVDRAIGWTRSARAHRPDRPWFCYLPFGATHAPFHLPQDWRSKYRGEFDHGWDEQRERTLARQKELGVVPPEAELAPWAPGIPAWAELDVIEQHTYARLMEAYAAFAEHTDAQVGRLVADLREQGELDNTLIFYILGDNGASAEGGLEGTINEMVRINGLEDSVDRIAEQLDDLGGPLTAPHYPAGWALAMDTPYQWTKQIASHYGGTRNGLVVHWPAGIAARGEIRHQWHHVIDIAPTVLEVAGLPHPDSVNGVPQQPIEGTSLAYTLDDADAPDRHTLQYFEMHGNRGLYADGWTAVTKHRTPWTVGQIELNSFAEDRWELYDTTTDWTQARDLAAEQPARLAELRRRFDVEAERHQVLPLDDRFLERLVPELTGRPAAPTSVRLTRHSTRLHEDIVPNVKNASYVVDIDFSLEQGDDGVLVSQGGRFGGWSIYVADGAATWVYNYVGIERTYLDTHDPLTPGRHRLQLGFAYDGGGLGRGGTASLWLDGAEQDGANLARTVPFQFSLDETLSVGQDWGSPVTERYPRGGWFAFPGAITSVSIEVGADVVNASIAEELRAVLAGH